MPTISRFYGVEILMFFNDHNPPHFHARYAEHEATITIATGRILAGQLPRGALRLVQEWLSLSEAELESNWFRARSRRPLEQIEPLP